MTSFYYGIIAVVAAVTATSSVVNGEVVLSEKIMKLSKWGAVLSNLAYVTDDPTSDGLSRGFDTFTYFADEPDAAIVAKRDGYCWGAFRGTTLTLNDWSQNFNPRASQVCDSEGVCCETRAGFLDAYTSTYTDSVEKSIRECAKSCENPDECVILTGHSQGGAVAAVAGVILADLNPYVLTYGQPVTLDGGCPKVSSERWYRWVNTHTTSQHGIEYDPIPFVPNLGSDQYGHLIILSNDTTGVAYIGLDAQDFFHPVDVAFYAHSIVGTEDSPGYLLRIEALMSYATTHEYPIRNNGYVAGSLCTQDSECQSLECAAETSFSWKRCVGKECDVDSECKDGERCDSGTCLPKLGSCAACDEDTDCATGNCFLFHCSGDNGLQDNECICATNSDCNSGRCEGLVPYPICEAQLPLDAHCDEDSDCLSGSCSWEFKCESAKSEKKTTIITWSIVGVAILVVLLVIIVCLWPKLRGLCGGYEQVPTSMDV